MTPLEIMTRLRSVWMVDVPTTAPRLNRYVRWMSENWNRFTEPEREYLLGMASVVLESSDRRWELDSRHRPNGPH